MSRSAVGARQLYSLVGTDQLRNGGKKAKAKKTSRRVGNGRAGAAEAIGSRADVGQLRSRLGSLGNGEEADGLTTSRKFGFILNQKCSILVI